MQLNNIVIPLSRIQGVKAIALGGSQSRGTADTKSDYDIGLYYDTDKLDIVALAQCLKELDDEHKDDLLSLPGQWGPWINGGAWLTVQSTQVDILLRDIKQVEKVVLDCIEGNITIDYQAGHPFGFVNTIYAAETNYCKLLWQDETMALNKLKDLLYSKGQYSPQMSEAVIKKFLWEAWFSISCGRKAAFRGDINYALGSVFKAVCSWVEVVFALNGCYLMNEKGALKGVNNLIRKPIDMEIRVNASYKLLADGNTEKAYQILEELHNEIDTLVTKI
ncbi:MAG: nucleotidyltransferase protein [Herbinix sp.]|jgi:hypothetical protein|nr:nucleotidyltransferase protein [Herbinix sp.]